MQILCDGSVPYTAILRKLATEYEFEVETRNGEKIRELNNVLIILKGDTLPYCVGRAPSLEYFKGEVDFYCSGSRSVEDASKISSFWKRCSDDGETINSNYGYLLLHQINTHGWTQFEHAFNCLVNNLYTKKAVMTLYNNEHAYISNDNPCTMFIQFFVRNRALHMHVVMRSNDVWYGLPYDLPWFRAVQVAMLSRINSRLNEKIELGTYTHQVMSLHLYERNLEKAYSVAALEQGLSEENEKKAIELYRFAADLVYNTSKAKLQELFMAQAWYESRKSKCLKKHCGCVLVHGEKIVGKGFGGRIGEECETCAREKGEKFYSDACYSVHGEMKAIVEALQAGHTDWANTTAYITHGPCDACCKLMDYIGLRQVYYAMDYKTQYKAHWPRLQVSRLTFEND